MIDQELEKQIMAFIRQEALRVEYGRITFSVNVLASNIVDIEGERVKTHKKFTKLSK